jgi:prepilin peptidase CpaA
MNVPSAALWLVALIALANATARDLKERLVPNRLVLMVLCTAIGVRIVNDTAVIGWSILATAIVGLILYGLADLSWIGWGDAKMTAAASLLVPPLMVVPLMLEIAIAGGLLGCLYLFARLAVKRGALGHSTVGRRRLTEGTFGKLVSSEAARIKAHEPMPYAFAIFGGVAYQFVGQVIGCYSAMHCSF